MASRSLPALLALQTELAGRSLQSALTHGLALARLSGEMLRDGLRSGPRRADRTGRRDPEAAAPSRRRRPLRRGASGRGAAGVPYGAGAPMWYAGIGFPSAADFPYHTTVRSGEDERSRHEQPSA